jgi:diguanylate cyclase (GGDEF)-like protein
VFGLFERVSIIMENVVAGGYVLALAIVCLLQYLIHFYRLLQVRRQSDHYRVEKESLETELHVVQKERTLTHLENSILREFISQTEIDRALDLLLRRFVPNARTGFGAFLTKDKDNRLSMRRSRGLSDTSCTQLVLNEELFDEIRREKSIVIENEQLHSHFVLSQLSHADRKKIRQLYLISVGEENESVGVLVTTGLFPTGAPQEQQVELGHRLMTSVAGNIRQIQALETQETRLRSTTEMLELRSITDRHYATPLAMIEEFVTSLSMRVGAGRAALYLTSQDPLAGSRVLIRCGVSYRPGIEGRWQEHEDRLAELGFQSAGMLFLDERELRQCGIDTLLCRAALIPLMHQGNIIGMLCLTSDKASSIGQSQEQLLNWAADHLGGTIQRALHHAVAERHARQDGLTELANRRAFDEQIREELSIAARSNTECSLLLLDLDHFKAVNDTHGHQAGDEVLRVVAKTLRREIARTRQQSRAQLARYGGEEMAVLLPDVDRAEAGRIAETIRVAVEQETVRLPQTTIHVTVSIGLASCPEHADTPPALIAAADAALYHAKQSGRNRVVLAVETLV